MGTSYMLGLRSDQWIQNPEGRLSALQQLENYRARVEGNRQPCMVGMRDLDPSVYGEHYFENGIEHIDLNSNLVNGSEPYQPVETLFHESRHAYQTHIVQNPELAENQSQLQDWQMSADGGYLHYPQEVPFSDYRFQPTEVDARDMARARTDELFEQTFQDKTNYPDYKSGKQQEIVRDIENARFQYGLDDNISDEEALPIIKDNARQSMIAKHDFQKAQAKDADKSQGVSPGSLPTAENVPSTEELSTTVGEIAGDAAGIPGGAEVGKIAGEVATKAQSVAFGQSTEAPNGNVEEATSETTSKSQSISGEQGGQASGNAHDAIEKSSKEAAGQAQSTTVEAIGQATDAPTNTIEKTTGEVQTATVESTGQSLEAPDVAAEETPSVDNSESDKNYYYGYGY